MNMNFRAIGVVRENLTNKLCVIACYKNHNLLCGEIITLPLFSHCRESDEGGRTFDLLQKKTIIEEW